MITLTDSIEIEATADVVYDWLVQRLRDMDSYRQWHSNHVDIRWIKGGPVQEGSMLHAEAYLHGVLHKLKFRITKVIPNRLIEYRVLFPFALLTAGNSFVIEPTGDGRCIFTANGSFRFPRWLYERMHSRHKAKIDAIQRHMREEGENLKRALDDGMR